MTRRSYEGLVVPAALYVASFALLVASARALGVATTEPPRLAAAIDAAQLFSPAGKLVFAWSERLDLALAAGRPSPLAPTILGGYVWALLARAPHATLDGLTAVRLGTVLFAAAVPPLVHAIARPWLGGPLALLAAVLTLLSPRGLVDGATLSGDGVAVALALGGLLFYLRSLDSRRAGEGLASAALFGLAAAVAPSSIALVPAVAVHYLLERPGATIRLARLGHAPLPLAIAALPILGAFAFVLAQPYLAHDTTARLRDLALDALSPSLRAGTWRGVPPLPDALPRTHALVSLLVALPSSTAVLAVVGAVGLSRFPRSALRDGGSRARLVALALTVVALGPLVAPRGLLAFPSHWALALPFAAVLAAFGAGVVARAAPPRAALSALVLAVSAAAPLGACLPSASLGAFFPALSGGASRAARGGPLPLCDATALGGLARAIDAERLESATVYAPDVPPDVWTWMQRLGRLRTEIVPTSRASAATLLVVSGSARGTGGTVLAEVHRDGQAIFTLLRR